MISKSQAGSIVILVLMVAAVAVVQFLADHHIYVPPIIGWVAGLTAASLTAAFRSVIPALSGKAAQDVAPLVGLAVSQLSALLRQPSPAAPQPSPAAPQPSPAAPQPSPAAPQPSPVPQPPTAPPSPAASAGPLPAHQLWHPAPAPPSEPGGSVGAGPVTPMEAPNDANG